MSSFIDLSNFTGQMLGEYRFYPSGTNGAPGIGVTCYDIDMESNKIIKYLIIGDEIELENFYTNRTEIFVVESIKEDTAKMRAKFTRYATYLERGIDGWWRGTNVWNWKDL